MEKHINKNNGIQFIEEIKKFIENSYDYFESIGDKKAKKCLEKQIKIFDKKYNLNLSKEELTKILNAFLDTYNFGIETNDEIEKIYKAFIKSKFFKFLEYELYSFGCAFRSVDAKKVNDFLRKNFTICYGDNEKDDFYIVFNYQAFYKFCKKNWSRFKTSYDATFSQVCRIDALRTSIDSAFHDIKYILETKNEKYSATVVNSTLTESKIKEIKKNLNIKNEENIDDITIRISLRVLLDNENNENYLYTQQTGVKNSESKYFFISNYGNDIIGVAKALDSDELKKYIEDEADGIGEDFESLKNSEYYFQARGNIKLPNKNAVGLLLVLADSEEGEPYTFGVYNKADDKILCNLCNVWESYDKPYLVVQQLKFYPITEKEFNEATDYNNAEDWKNLLKNIGN